MESKIANFDTFVNENDYKHEDETVKQILSDMTELSADGVESLLFGLAKYFADEKESITNMDASAISGHIKAAAELVKKRTGN